MGTAPLVEHEWLAAHGDRRKLAAGEILVRQGTLAPSLHIVFAGHLVIRLDRGAGSHKIYEWRGGDVSGALPFSRGARAPNDVVVEEATDYLAVAVEHLPAMIRECPVITATLVHAMLDRARHFNANDLRDEKLVSLGKLAAGLAHEAAETCRLLEERRRKRAAVLNKSDEPKTPGNDEYADQRQSDQYRAAPDNR